MKIKFNGKKSIITKSVDEYLTTKLSKIDKYFEPNEVVATVHIDIKNLEQAIEISIPTKYFTIRAEERNKDLYTSIDLVVDKLERQITKNKSKMQKKYSSQKDFDLNIDFEEDVEQSNVQIIRRKSLNSKPMDEEEAILQMQLINHDFFVFKNVDEECVSVIYKRKDEKYGIINVK